MSDIEQPRGRHEGLAPKRKPLVLLYTGHGKGKTSFRPRRDAARLGPRLADLLVAVHQVEDRQLRRDARGAPAWASR